MRWLGSEPAMDSAGASLYVHSRALQPRRAARELHKKEERVPTYEYRCRDCKNVFDRIEPLSEHGTKAPSCPKCKSRNVEQVLTSFFAKTSHKS